MLSLLTLSLLCLISIPALLVFTLLFSIPLALAMAILPWLLRLAGVVLLLRGLMERPFHLDALLPAALAFGLSFLLR